MNSATTKDVRDIFLDHLERLQRDYMQRRDDCMVAASQAADADGWTAGLERGLAMAYDAAAHDLAEAVKVERGLNRAVSNVPGAL